ncbi:hypothetical protein LPUS_09819 [Lasallia pustulata]|uniref:PD-(D/E)XK nuclease-like domain-containing protein n=1 Tax=Lasallia pustulata TaxID=136370 RepID=A0A1W5D8R8_9LECA|nr:hypothetical protein LPUS_09819 [Lasallia pustulata]
MEEGNTLVDPEKTPRPSKKRNIGMVEGEFVVSSVALPEVFDAQSQSSPANSELESHKSGRMSPSKQMAQLEDPEHPIKVLDFGSAEASILENVEKMRAEAQLLADGVGILGYNDGELATLRSSRSRLDPRDRTRFNYTWANDFSKRRETGIMPDLTPVLNLVSAAIQCQSDREHENSWNEDIHKALINMAVGTSRYAQRLAVKSLKTASIDPPTLAEVSLPKRVVDYGIVLVPDDRIKKAFLQLQPLAPATVKSWNHTTANNVRQTPIAVNIETKASDKSWTDGKPQLAIWTSALFKRLQKLVGDEAAANLRIPAMPLVIAQGHDWHLLIISHQPSPEEGRTVIWQKIDIGNTRNCFDIYKIIAVLHLVVQWAETTWRPWFYSLLDLAKM